MQASPMIVHSSPTCFAPGLAPGPALRPVTPAQARSAGAEPGAEAGLLRAVLDHLQLGIVAVGPDGRVQHANRAARAHGARHPELRIDERQRPDCAAHADRLVQAIAAARAGRWTLVTLGSRGAAADDERLTIAVVPLGRGQGADGTVLLLFSPPRGADALAMQLFARAAGLTSAEARVLRALADGQAPSQIARQNDVALSTVRSQVGSIRAKTGARSITELARAVGRLPPVMPAVSAV